MKPRRRKVWVVVDRECGGVLSSGYALAVYDTKADADVDNGPEGQYIGGVVVRYDLVPAEAKK